jgi:hypothetical protein
MRGQGLVYHRLLPSNTLTDLGVKRQFQHPCFSTTGKYLAIAEMHFRDTSDSFLRSDALVSDKYHFTLYHFTSYRTVLTPSRFSGPRGLLRQL